MVVNKLNIRQLNYRAIFWVTAFFLLFILQYLSPDYGLTNDEPIHRLHGQTVLAYFQGKDSTAALSPIDSSGNIIKTFAAVKDEKFRGMNFFGGFFDLLSARLEQALPQSDPYLLRHRLSALFGWLLFLFIGLTAKEVAGWKSALLALVLAALSPRLFGHAFANPKDIPFAALYAMGIHRLLVLYKKLPALRPLDLLTLLLLIAIAIDIRVSGLLLIPYLFLTLTLFYAFQYLKTKELKLRQLLINYLIIIILSLVSYGAVGLLWPWAAHDLWAPLKVLSGVSTFKVFNAYELFNGQWYNAWEIPYNYVPVWIWISIPASLALGMLLSPGFFWKKFRGDLHPALLILLAFFAWFPVAYVVARHSNIYNGIRHLTFIFPPLIVLSALAWQRLLVLLKRTAFYYTAVAALLASLLQPLLWSIRNHPYEAMYFNPLSGGARAAFGRYETDYWGISTKEAVEWIAAHTTQERQNGSIKVKMFYGDREKFTHYAKAHPHLEYFAGNATMGFDYEIIFVAQAKFSPNLIKHWPPENTVHEIKAGGAALCAIVKSPYGQLTIEELAEKFPTEDNLINLSLYYYNKGAYFQAVEAAKRVLQINPHNRYALNNIGAAANALGLYKIAYKYLLQAIEQDSSFQLARNNFRIAVQKMETEKDEAGLIAHSVSAYQLGEYEACIAYCRDVLKLNPRNATAYNNICSAYNALKDYPRAIKACQHALRLKPDFQLAKNNLQAAQQALNASSP